jgi:hypothetical protein
MPDQDSFLTSATRRLAALIDDQERLLKVIRKDKAELMRVDLSTHSSLPTKPR